METQPKRDEWLRQFLEQLETMSPERAVDEVADAMSIISQLLDRTALLRLRAYLVERCSESPHLVGAIDEQMALHEPVRRR